MTKAKQKTKTAAKGKVGSSFEGFLKNEGTYEETTSLAIKRVLAWQIEQAMSDQGVTKAKMAARMKTSLSQLDRLLDPCNDKVQLDTLHRAALALGKRMMISLEDAGNVR
ncbi:MAG: Fis family transcriptional regulator [Rhodospirillales bacterium RIFCSPLOWO2_12_FULL_58_28]|nr:MAG: Fis family transcriptional regulator [Rhodospirillales bacterium RIFCSPLOWO2_02_FULL_58_16]OHC79910.1 MAG: Fis family transcriptional regulator [Rhodospirillales bacterium RIFCSPLOWO2_12_FULL_58_28]